MQKTQKMNERDDVDEYIKRFSKLPAEKILQYLGEMREFFLKNMTEDGKRFFSHQKNHFCGDRRIANV